MLKVWLLAIFDVSMWFGWIEIIAFRANCFINI